MKPESRRAGEVEREAPILTSQPSPLSPHSLPRTSKAEPVFLIHNTGGEESAERAAEEGVLETVDGVAESLSHLGWRVERLALEPPLSEAARHLEDLPPASLAFNLFEGFPRNPASEVQVGLLLMSLGLRATGCPPLAMHLGLHKDLCKEVLASRGLPPSPGVVLRRAEDAERVLPFPYPVFLKPVADDASHGIGPENLAVDAGAFRRRFADLLERFPSGVLAEAFLPGREFNCAVVETPEGPRALPPSLVDYSRLPADHPPVLTFAAKWQPENPIFDLTPTLCPAPVEGALIQRIQALSLEAFRALRCRGYARVDMREDQEGVLRILEVNPNPDLAPSAGLAKQARAMGWTYHDLVATVLEAAEKGPRWTS